jgi:hypothetical protein
MQRPEPGDFVITLEGIPAEATSVRAVSVRNAGAPDPRPAAWQNLTPQQSRFFIRPLPGGSNPAGSVLRVVAFAEGNPCSIAYAEVTLPQSELQREVTVTLKPESDPLCRMPIPDSLVRIRGLWGTSDRDIWAVGESFSNTGNWLAHFDGQSWQPVDTPKAMGSMYAIAGASATDIWAVGNNNSVFHYDGSAWTLRSIPGINGSYADILVRNANDVWFASSNAQLVRYDGTGFTAVPCPNAPRFWTVWGTSTQNNIWAGGFSDTNNDGSIDLGGIWRWNGTSCSTSVMFSQWGPRRIRGNGDSDVLAVGVGDLRPLMAGGRAAEALNWRGAMWEPIIPATGVYLRDLWAGAPGMASEYLSVGELGVIVKGKGQINWSSVSNSSTDYLYSIWSQPASAYLYMGGDNFVHRYRIR